MSIDSPKTSKNKFLVAIAVCTVAAVAVIVMVLNKNSHINNNNTGNISDLEQIEDGSNVYGIVKMQDMTTEICANASVGDNQRLVDTRDGKKYWVTKMPDNNCWMTQNLDFDIPTNGLTSKDSDIANKGSSNNANGKWDSSSVIPVQATKDAISEDFSDIYDEPLSYDPGDYYYNGIILEEDSHCRAIADFSACPEAFSESGNSHYHVGNFYKWYAATAGTGNDGGTDAPDSICPKGWRLPTGGPDGDGVRLAETAGMDSTEKWVSEPFYFVLNGGIDANQHSLAGIGAHIWTSTVEIPGEIFVFGIGFRGNKLGFDRPTLSYRAFSVRCVAR